MRYLLITRYHHFSFLIISCALLGFGIGGIILSSYRGWFARHGRRFFPWGCLFFGISVPLCFILGQSIPLSVYFPPGDTSRVVLWWSVYWLIQTIPFVVAGTLTGWTLSGSLGCINLVYACSLVGASSGVALSLIFLSSYAPNQLIMPLALLVAASCVPLVAMMRDEGRYVYAGCVAVSAVFGIANLTSGDTVFPFIIDEYKYSAHIEQLSAENAARRSALFDDLRGRIELYSSPHFHALLSFSSTRYPPVMDIVMKDGMQVGTIPHVKNALDACFLNDTLFALPYKLMKPERVLILGESGSLHLWTSLLHQPRTISFVQFDRNVVRVLEQHPTRPLDDPSIVVHLGGSRSFVETTGTKFDIIQLAEIEGFSAGSSGIGGLRENYLATVEGFGRCLEVLSPRGLVCSVRGIQDPPRDNLKILGTWFKALEERKVPRPLDHILMARDELSCAIICSREPLQIQVVEEFFSACRNNSWDVEWAPGIDAGITNQVHKIPGPEGSNISWYHEFLMNLASNRGTTFYENWTHHVRPATDDKPFYFDFFLLSSVAELKRLFGPLWPTRSEMGFLVLLVCLALTTIIATSLIPMAMIIMSRTGTQIRVKPLLWSVSYFVSIGTGFMLAEMMLIQMFTRLFGDPVTSAGIVLGGILLFSGIGSALQPQVTQRSGKGMFGVGLVTGLLILAIYAAITHLFSLAWDLGPTAKIGMALMIMAPLGLLMGTAFPWGMATVNARATSLLPLCWAVNCFASVVASPLAIIIAMSLGYTMLWILCAITYLCVGLQALAEDRMLA